MSAIPASSHQDDGDRDPLEEEEVRIAQSGSLRDLESAREHRWDGEAGMQNAEVALYQASGGLIIPQNYRFPWWRAILAGFLLLLGFILFVVGAANGLWVMIIVGIVLMLPGGYQVYLIVQVMRRVPGFEPDGIFERLDY